ncbi:MAG TPA: cyclase family protein [Candidatus Dormibacteraeota bacterium]|nr:cyclase family protein [Candidatus Dormibacteraeota bacterium]
MSTIDTAKTASLIAAASAARIYDLGHGLEASTPVSPNHPPFRMALMRRHGDRMREDGGSGANEMLSLGCHTGTHIDALCHVSHEGHLYGGVDAAEASHGGRFNVYGAETIAPFVCRGVLLDVPRALGMETLEAAHATTAEELEATARAQGVEVRAGDAVLIRSGWPARHWNDAEAFIGWKSGVPGPDASAGRWLAEREIRVAGADTIAFEWLAPGAGHSRLPAHITLIVEHGIHILEVLDLEQLARDRVYEFLFVCSPLKLVGATGSPVRPLAVVA